MEKFTGPVIIGVSVPVIPWAVGSLFTWNAESAGAGFYTNSWQEFFQEWAEGAIYVALVALILAMINDRIEQTTNVY